MASARKNKPKTGGQKSFSIWPFSKQKAVSRKFERYPCCVIAVMHLLDRGYDVDGVLLEISEGGLLFRMASQFIIERSAEPVSVHFDTLQVTGTIVNVRSQGYGISLDEPLDVMDVRRISALFNSDQAKRGGFGNQTGPERRETVSLDV